MVSPVQSQLLWTKRPPCSRSAASASAPSSTIVRRVESAKSLERTLSADRAVEPAGPGVRASGGVTLRGSAKLMRVSVSRKRIEGVRAAAQARWTVTKRPADGPPILPSPAGHSRNGILPEARRELHSTTRPTARQHRTIGPPFDPSNGGLYTRDTGSTTRMTTYDEAAEARHRALREQFLIRPVVAFLNHASFGACPKPVFEKYQAWQLELEQQPVEFIGRRRVELLGQARAALATYLNADADEIVYQPNVTQALNIPARSLPLKEGDEILATDHEYGALERT